MRKLRSLTVMGFAGAIAIVMAACGTSTNNSPSASATVPAGLSVTSFDASFSAMSQLKGLTAAGKGLVGVILPDTTSSTRYVAFDAPYLKKAFEGAGYSASQFKIDNAQGNDATELAQAQADITQGAKVLVFDPLNSTVGAQIQSYAQSHGVKTISYDRATFQGTNTYYVSFDNVQVGKLIGKGFTDCVTAWGISSPKVFTLDGGEDTDPNAVSFAQGYNSVIWGSQTTPLSAGQTNSEGYTLVGDQIAPNWVNATGGTIFQQQYTAHKEINATIEANDGLANAVITVLKNSGCRRQESADHRTGRDLAGHDQRAPGLPVRLGLQGRLPRGPGRGRAGDHPARRPDASVCPPQRHDLTAIGRLGQPAAGVAAGPDLGDDREHGVDRHQGQLRRQDRPLQRRWSERLHRRRHQLNREGAAALRGGALPTPVIDT